MTLTEADIKTFYAAMDKLAASIATLEKLALDVAAIKENTSSMAENFGRIKRILDERMR